MDVDAQPVRTEGKVLIIDDEPSMRRTLHTALFGLGFDIGEAGSGEEAIELCRIVKYDAVLLDINLPGKSGIETCVELRKMRPRLAILVVSVNDDHERKVKALEAGADDYVIKPFHMRELTARIRSSLRRTRTATAVEIEDVITIGDLSLNIARRLVEKAGCPIHLTPKEFDLLHYLMMNRGLPVTHARLLGQVWGAQYVGQVEYLRSFVRQLRKKLDDDAAHPRYLLTENHIGYRFVDPDLDAFTKVEHFRVGQDGILRRVANPAARSQNKRENERHCPRPRVSTFDQTPPGVHATMKFNRLA